jgi:hypothetical protein
VPGAAADAGRQINATSKDVNAQQRHRPRAEISMEISKSLDIALFLDRFSHHR